MYYNDSHHAFYNSLNVPFRFASSPFVDDTQFLSHFWIFWSTDNTKMTDFTICTSHFSSQTLYSHTSSYKLYNSFDSGKYQFISFDEKPFFPESICYLSGQYIHVNYRYTHIHIHEVSQMKLKVMIISFEYIELLFVCFLFVQLLFEMRKLLSVMMHRHRHMHTPQSVTNIFKEHLYQSKIFECVEYWRIDS